MSGPSALTPVLNSGAAVMAASSTAASGACRVPPTDASERPTMRPSAEDSSVDVDDRAGDEA
jgi:hypothetical protein